MLRSLTEIRGRMAAIEAELRLAPGLELEQGLDLLNVCGRGRDRLVVELGALRRELAVRALVESRLGGG